MKGVRPVQSILVPVDFSKHSQEALKQALLLAEILKAKIHVLHVFREKPTWADELVTPVSVGMSSKNFDLLLHEAAELTLEKFLKPYAQSTVKLSQEITQGSPAEAILQATEEGNHDLVVIGRSGQGNVSRLLLGSIVERVLRHAKIPVLVTTENAAKNIKKILVPVDFFEASEDSLRTAIDWAKSLKANITCLHVQEPPFYFLSDYPSLGLTDPKLTADLIPMLEKAAKERLDDLKQPYLSLGVDIHSQVVTGEASKSIVDFGQKENVDLIVIGSGGRSRLSYFFLGGTAEKVLRTASVPVLVVKIED